jgi:hypothetical protein
MTDPKAKTITGASDRPFERACYAVIAHDDGTGTVVLDWYETSVGRDFMMSEEFMRAEIDTARQIVQLLNQQLPGRVHAITEYPVSDSDALESSDYDWTRYTLDKGRRLDLAQRIEERLIFLLRNEPLDEEQDVMGELEHELEKLGEWVAMNNQTPVTEDCHPRGSSRQVPMPKNIVVFSDGTGQDGGVRPEQRMTNVYKLYRASHNHPDSAVNPREQVSFYDPGLGTDIGSTALTAPVRFVQKLLGSVVGQGIKRNIADCYEFIINHYQPGDRVFLIGFSRGAYTVRCVANLLMLCGVPTKTPSSDLMRFRKPVRDIAKEAVDTVLEHGAGFPREKYEAERFEMARLRL